MMWNLPITIEIEGVEYKIRNKCDYRVVLDVIAALNDTDLDIEYRLQCALFIFYEDLSKCNDIDTAVAEMYKVISYGEMEKDAEKNKPSLMNWEYDFKHISPPVSRILGYDVRTPDKYTHWYTFLGAYMEIGECAFQTVVAIRSKRMKGKPLEQWEQDFYKENKKMIDLPLNLTEEEQDWLNFDW